MTALVTGGAGFIGSHLVDALVEKGHQVAVVDNLSTGLTHNINPLARFYEMDILDDKLAEVFGQQKPKVVYHLAAQVSVNKSVEDPATDAIKNILGSLRIILFCLRFDVSTIVYISSGGAVYGQPQYLPVDETHPVRPVSPYGVSKHAIEEYLYVYGVSHNLNYTILRLPNVYGPRQDPRGEAGVVPIFATQMIHGERPTIFGDGNKSRDYTYVADVVSAILLATQSGMKRDIFNVGTSLETTDRQVFDLVAEGLGYRGSPWYSTVRKGDVERICLSSSKIREQVGWKALTSFKEGLVPTLEYYRTIPRGERS